MKVLGCRDLRTMTMEKDSEVPRCRVLMVLLSTDDSNDSQKCTCAALTTYLTLAYPLFHVSDHPFLVSCPKGVR